MISPGETAVSTAHDWTPERVRLFLEGRDWVATSIQPRGPLRESFNWSWSFTEMDSGTTFDFFSCGPPLFVVLERLAILGAAATGKHRNVSHP